VTVTGHIFDVIVLTVEDDNVTHSVNTEGTYILFDTVISQKIVAVILPYQRIWALQVVLGLTVFLTVFGNEMVVAGVEFRSDIVVVEGYLLILPYSLIDAVYIIYYGGVIALVNVFEENCIVL